MCGRFTLGAAPEALVAAMSLTEVPAGLTPRYNIAPSQPVPAVRRDASGGRRLYWLRWGLVPGWAADPAVGNRMINARAETASSRPAFRSAFKHRRCLVLADGFYEWRRSGKGPKQPFLFRRPDRGPFGFAGLWERWQPPQGEEPLETCTVLTTEANALLAEVHDRMPVILGPADYDLWLDPELQDLDRLQALLRPCPEGLLESVPVGRWVNNPRFDDPRCIEPVQPPTDDLFGPGRRG